MLWGGSLKDSYYLKHDTNASHDPKMEAMIQRYKMAGYGRFWRLAEVLREQADGRMRRDKWCLATLAQCWKCNEKQADEFLSALINDYELIVSDKQYIWSERIKRDMAVLEKRRQEARHASAMRWHSERNADAMPGDNGGNPILGILGKVSKRGGDV